MDWMSLVAPALMLAGTLMLRHVYRQRLGRAKEIIAEMGQLHALTLLSLHKHDPDEATRQTERWRRVISSWTERWGGDDDAPSRGEPARHAQP